MCYNVVICWANFLRIIQQTQAHLGGTGTEGETGSLPSYDLLVSRAEVGLGYILKIYVLICLVSGMFLSPIITEKVTGIPVYVVYPPSWVGDNSLG